MTEPPSPLTMLLSRHTKRRGAAAAWSLATRAQQAELMRRIGVLSAFASDYPAQQSRVAPSAGAALWGGQIESL